MTGKPRSSTASSATAGSFATPERFDSGNRSAALMPGAGRSDGDGAAVRERARLAIPESPSFSGGSIKGPRLEISVTPKPHYGADGNKVFGIAGTPDGLCEALEQSLGQFPFHTFWGPKAGLPCTAWIARCAAEIIKNDRPELTLIYLPHLDYDPQRFGPSGCDMSRLARELDDACAVVLDAAAAAGARVWTVSEYGHADVNRAILLNRMLREAGLLKVRQGPFGETLDTFGSRAFAVCDHQVAHVYLDQSVGRATLKLGRARELIAALPGVEGGSMPVAESMPRSVSIILDPGDLAGLVARGFVVCLPILARRSART